MKGNFMKYSKTTLMELSHKYSSILRKCALLNATILVGTMLVFPVGAVNVDWNGVDPLVMTEGDVWTTNTTQTVTGKISGVGTILSRPGGSAAGSYTNETLTINSDISAFSGNFQTRQFSNGTGNPNAISTIIFNTRNINGINLVDNGDFIFKGTGEVKVFLDDPSTGIKRVFLNDHALSTASTSAALAIGGNSIYLGSRGGDSSGRSVKMEESTYKKSNYK